jgi:chromosome segregation and condensation protein ScpB
MQRMHNRYAQPLDSQNLRAARGSAGSPPVFQKLRKKNLVTSLLS